MCASCVIQTRACPPKQPRREAHPWQAVDDAPSVVWANNPANAVVVFAAALGSTSAEMPATPGLSTLGSRASRPAKVSRPHSEAYNVHALWRLSVTNITVFAYVVTTSCNAYTVTNKATTTVGSRGPFRPSITSTSTAGTCVLCTCRQFVS